MTLIYILWYIYFFFNIKFGSEEKTIRFLLSAMSSNIHPMKKTYENIFTNFQIVKLGETDAARWIDCRLLYSEGKGNGETICMSLGAANSCNCSHVNIDVDDTNDDIVFNEGDAQDDGDKLVTLSTRGAVEVERKNHARMTYDSFIRICSSEKYICTLAGQLGNKKIYNRLTRRCNLSTWNIWISFICVVFNKKIIAKFYSQRTVVMLKIETTQYESLHLNYAESFSLLYLVDHWIKKELNYRTVL